MPLIILARDERQQLLDLFTEQMRLARRYPAARQEAMTALRCLKAIHSNAIEDKRVDRVFLQVLLHNAGIEDKTQVSLEYQKASEELRGQQTMLLWLEEQAAAKAPVSLSLLMEMHRLIFHKSWPDQAGRFRTHDVRISMMQHMPPHHSKMATLLQMHLDGINEEINALAPITADNLLDLLNLSARAHYLIAHVHPFNDGNGRVARSMGDYIFLRFGLYYDVIMTSYRDYYLDAMEESTLDNPKPLSDFLQYSYLETMQRISGLFVLCQGPHGPEPLT